ncbi:RNA polymerase II subunit A C-terminal domain phosphatase [Fulvia fulva]|uniref:RNA polymerase II subunit A C-terminal domain phosphatase n=1 Tax=Passalora fulva TaxID=5499 RepID=A0A9Q8PG70_PASFU|nr:RNA polymerase II subunit A C-terminal domain phosphatase [Fulvia fulva]KAK4613624.1 RNA polymerase II subunit A C-terminal domain phosphatase [Fulvia fulva]KAK4614433.1 RNA polymerase II subunit A C-terminal domain phosphatase [Fulvia fulva]UJO21812.1 RNA polymerase II subunit A C-terminal domain phosphatase [Fulvia fulva]WPV20472.1 RNA polymerase II subunit A C-terminal domain phosphatase [Fulvia fulva]WPV34867.1 RNA polymerase II subunit A C-terminal domain phosphatase [Fulvia fulva]
MVRLETSDSLRYPIRITKLLKKAGDQVARNEAVFYYEFKGFREEFDEDTRETVPVERWWPSQYESEFEGTITSIRISKEQELTRRTLVGEIEEACRHEVQFGGLCADCGKDVNEITSYNETTSLASRATINTTHGRTDLLVSCTEASKADEEAKRRLLETRRLSLVVDLDQTVIHACVEPTIGEWQNDPSNPNHEAVKDVCKFQLADDAPGRPGTWYYIKLRPGLKEFLTTMSQYYEMHIYTMGTRAYAENIAKIIDPDRAVFGDRILSRDESGSMQVKNLKRLFPVDTKMVVIIDDRADVWAWVSNLIKVKVFEFFVGIGDVNSSFLPKRPELEAKPESAKMERVPSKKTDAGSDTSDATTNSDASATSTAPTTPPATNGAVSAVEQMVSMAGKQDAGSIKSKEEEQDQTIAKQLDDRPLLQKQRILDELEKEEEAEAEASPAAEAAVELLSGNGEKQKDAPDTAPKKHYRHNLLQDDDTELQYLTQSLRNIHAAYYEEYDLETAGSKGSRVAELRPGHTKKRSVDQFEHIPDAAVIMDDMKRKVLAGVNLVFSGVVPLGVDVQSHDMAVWARSFGAKVSENIGKKTTHIIASPDRRTAKVRQAAKKGNRIAIVKQSWLFDCFSQWKRLDENPYRIHSDAPANGSTGLPESFEHETKDYMLSSSDEEAAQTEDETDGTETPNGNGGLTINTDLNDDTDLEELEKYAPKLSREDSSPILAENAEDWDAINAELEDLESGSDSEAESTRSHDSTYVESSAKKRKQADRESEDEADGSRLSKRKKEALSRTTSLTNMIKTAESTPRANMEDDETDQPEDADDDYDLEAALEAEMARDSEDEGAAAETNGTGDA